jgi:hypothetical protein
MFWDITGGVDTDQVTVVQAIAVLQAATQVCILSEKR